MKSTILVGYIFWFLVSHQCCNGFTTVGHKTVSSRGNTGLFQEEAQPRTGGGLAQGLLNVALASPLWKYWLVPQARANIVKTAEANGIPWNTCLSWLQQQDGPWNNHHHHLELENVVLPSYYQQPFHAYEDGNLCWEAAMEQELAGRAVGVRNFPAYGKNGEDAFREAFDVTFTQQCGAFIPLKDDAIIVDLGCGTGTSTRRLATNHPTASQIIGIDLSPYMIAVGNRLLELAPNQNDWVTAIQPDDRIALQVGDATNTGLNDASVDVVHVGLVLHELPIDISKQIINEAHRILKPNGGQLWISEMDFDSPAFQKQRSNPLLFSLIRSTEPYLDVYADGCFQIRNHTRTKFQKVTIAAATGRHYAMVAIKDKDTMIESCDYQDKRFQSDGTYAVGDTHLKTWESKK